MQQALYLILAILLFLRLLTAGTAFQIGTPVGVGISSSSILIGANFIFPGENEDERDMNINVIQSCRLKVIPVNELGEDTGDVIFAASFSQKSMVDNNYISSINQGEIFLSTIVTGLLPNVPYYFKIHAYCKGDVFVQSQKSNMVYPTICGNHIVEYGEECDFGVYSAICKRCKFLRFSTDYNSNEDEILELKDDNNQEVNILKYRALNANNWIEYGAAFYASLLLEMFITNPDKLEPFYQVIVLLFISWVIFFMSFFFLGLFGLYLWISGCKGKCKCFGCIGEQVKNMNTSCYQQQGQIPGFSNGPSVNSSLVNGGCIGGLNVNGMMHTSFFDDPSTIAMHSGVPMELNISHYGTSTPTNESFADNMIDSDSDDEIYNNDANFEKSILFTAGYTPTAGESADFESSETNLIEDGVTNGDQSIYYASNSNINSNITTAAEIDNYEVDNDADVDTSEVDVVEAVSGEFLSTDSSKVSSTNFSQVSPTNFSKVSPTNFSQVLPTNSSKVLPTNSFKVSSTADETSSTDEVLFTGGAILDEKVLTADPINFEPSKFEPELKQALRHQMTNQASELEL